MKTYEEGQQNLQAILPSSEFNIGVDSTKNEDVLKIKSQAAVLLLQAKQLIQSKNQQKHKQAQNLFISIGKKCMSIENPDEQVTQWLQISCKYLTHIHRHHQRKRNTMQNINTQRSSFIQGEELILCYNKFANQFQLDERHRDYDSKEVRCYISKINGILFENQNVKIGNSCLVMLTTYWFPFAIIFVLMILIFLFLGLHISFGTIEIQAISLEFQIPTFIIFLTFILPMLMIALKKPEQKNSQFFQKKLDEIIEQINLDCQNRGKNITFMKPHGSRIKIKLNAPKSERGNNWGVRRKYQQNFSTPSDDFSRAMKSFKFNISKFDEVNYDIISFC